VLLGFDFCDTHHKILTVFESLGFNVDILAVLGEVQRITAVQPVDGFDCFVEGKYVVRVELCADGDVFVAVDTQIVGEQVVAVAVAQNEVAGLILDLDTGGRRFVEGLVIESAPLPQNFQGALVNGTQGAVGLGTYVEQEIGAIAAADGKAVDEVLQGFEVEVLLRVAPVAGEGLTHLAGDVLRGVGHVDALGSATLEGDAVQLNVTQRAPTGKTRIVDDHSIRLVGADHTVKGIFLPIVVRPVPHTVKPDTADLAVVFADDFHALAKIFQVFGEVFPVAFLVPVQKGVVEKRNDAVLITGVHKFPHQVPAAHMGRVVGVQATGVVQGKAVVVAGCQGDVPATGILGGQNQLFGPVFVGAEGLHRLQVLFPGHTQCVLRPFALAQNAVKAEVDKHTKAECFKFLDAFFDDHRKTSVLKLFLLYTTPWLNARKAFSLRRRLFGRVTPQGGFSCRIVAIRILLVPTYIVIFSAKGKTNTELTCSQEESECNPSGFFHIHSAIFVVDRVIVGATAGLDNGSDTGIPGNTLRRHSVGPIL